MPNTESEYSSSSSADDNLVNVPLSNPTQTPSERMENEKKKLLDQQKALDEKAEKVKLLNEQPPVFSICLKENQDPSRALRKETKNANTKTTLIARDGNGEFTRFKANVNQAVQHVESDSIIKTVEQNNANIIKNKLNREAVIQKKDSNNSKRLLQTSEELHDADLVNKNVQIAVKAIQYPQTEKLDADVTKPPLDKPPHYQQQETYDLEHLAQTSKDDNVNNLHKNSDSFFQNKAKRPKAPSASLPTSTEPSSIMDLLFEDAATSSIAPPKKLISKSLTKSGLQSVSDRKSDLQEQKGSLLSEAIPTAEPSKKDNIPKIVTSIKHFLKLLEYPESYQVVLSNSNFLKSLWGLCKETLASECISVNGSSKSPRLFLSTDEVEAGIFWDESLYEFIEKRRRKMRNSQQDTLKTQVIEKIGQRENENERVLTLSEIWSIPFDIGYRSRLTVWQSALSRLLDRAILASAELEETIYNETVENTDDHLFPQKKLIAFEEMVIWTSRIIRLAALFSVSGSIFATTIISNWLFPSENDSNLSGSVNMSHPTHPFQPDKRRDIVAIQSEDPLAALRFFEHDKVFVSAEPFTIPGGGFLGILVLGSETVDMEQACRIYGREIQAQQWLFSNIVRLKSKYARDSLRAMHESPSNVDMFDTSNIKPNVMDRLQKLKKGAKRSRCFSVARWMSKPLTFLTPLLVNIVDYKGFRVVVYPLFHRPPMLVPKKSLGVSTRLTQEIKDLETLLTTQFNVRSVTNFFDLLQIEHDHPSIVVIHKAYKLLFSESDIGTGGLHTLQTYNKPATLRPELSLMQKLAELSMHSIKRRSDLPNPHYSIRHTQLLSKTYPSVECHLGEPFGIAAFERASKGYNQFVLPYPSFVELGDIERFQAMTEQPTSRTLTEFLYAVAIPGALQSLESQPFFTPIDAIGTKKWLQGAGISCRHLGQLLNTTRHFWVRKLLMVDIVGRTLKHILMSSIKATLFLQNQPDKDDITSPSKKSLFSSISIPATAAASLPIPKHLASCLLDDSWVQQSFYPFNVSDLNVSSKSSLPNKMSKLTMPEFFALNLLRVVMGKTHVSRDFWREVIAPQAELRFACNRILIDQSMCPRPALLQSFCHHTGLHLLVDVITFSSRLQPFTLSVNNNQSRETEVDISITNNNRPVSYHHQHSYSMSQNTIEKSRRLNKTHYDDTLSNSDHEVIQITDYQGWNVRTRCSLDYHIARTVLPAFEYIEEPIRIPLMPKHVLEMITMDDNNNNRENNDDIITSHDPIKNNSMNNALLQKNNRTTTTSGYIQTTTLTTATASQIFIAKNLATTFSALGCLSLLRHRELERHNIITQTLRTRNPKTEATEKFSGDLPEQTIDIMLSKQKKTILPRNIGLLETSSPLTVYYWIEPIETIEAINPSGWDLPIAILDLTVWAMWYGLWDLAVYFSIESLSVYPEVHIASVFSRWFIAWSEIHQFMQSPAEYPLDYESLSDNFCTIMDLISCYWEGDHPLVADTILAKAWCLYVLRDLPKCEKAIKAAIDYTLAISDKADTNNIFSLYHNDFRTICQHIFDPYSKRFIDKVPPLRAESKIASLLRLLGNICLAQASSLLLSLKEEPLLEATVNLNSFDGSIKTSLEQPTLKDSIQPGIESNILNLCYDATECLSAAAKVFGARAVIHHHSLLLAGTQYEIASALLLQLQHKKDVQKISFIENECLLLSSKSFQIRCRHLPPRHVEIIQSSLQLAILLERRCMPHAALRLWEQLLSDISNRLRYQVKYYKEINKNDLKVHWNTYIWDQCRILTQSYRPLNILSMMLWALPNAHFLGLYDSTDLNDTRHLKHVEITFNKIADISDLHMIPDVTSIKAKVLTLYVNHCWTAVQLSRLFCIFQDIRHLEKLLLNRDRLARHTMLEAYLVDPWQYCDNLEPQVVPASYHYGNDSSSSIINAKDIALLIEIVTTYPHLLHESELLGDGNDPYLAAAATSASISSPYLKHTNQDNELKDNSTIDAMLGSLEHTENFFTNLLNACHSDIDTYKNHIMSDSTYCPLLSLSKKTNHHQPTLSTTLLSTLTENYPIISDTHTINDVENVANKVNAIQQEEALTNSTILDHQDSAIRLLEMSLNLKSPLEIYQFHSKPLDILCTILNLYLDVNLFKQLKVSEHCKSTLSIITNHMDNTTSFVRDHELSKIQWCDPDTPLEVGQIHYVKDYEEIINILEQIGLRNMNRVL